MQDKRTVILLDGSEKPFAELYFGDVFTIREGTNEILEGTWECCSEVYANDEGILTVMANPYN